MSLVKAGTPREKIYNFIFNKTLKINPLLEWLLSKKKEKRKMLMRM